MPAATSEAALAALREALDDDHIAARAAAIEALGELGDRQSAVAIAGLRSAPSLAISIARALGALDHRSTLEALFQIASGDGFAPTARRWAARGLAASRHPEALDGLRALEASDDLRVQRLARAGVSRLGG